jgi:hypothetical protein
LSDDVDVYIDDEPADLEDLAVNMIVKVYIEDDEIIEISFRSDDEDEVVRKRYEGEILDFDDDFEEITIEEDEEELTFTVTDETNIHVPVLSDELIEEFVGLNAKVIAENTTATSIWIEFDKLEGILVDINFEDDELVSVDVKLNDSTTETYTFYEDFEICVDGEKEELTDDYLGHIVEMKLLGSEEIVTLCVLTEVDRDDLEDLVEDAEELEEENYTEETWDDFEIALSDALDVLEEDYPTQDEVDTAYDNLKDAMENLIATVTDLVIVDENVVTYLDNENTEITVAFGTTVGALETALGSDFEADFEVLGTSGGYEVDDGVEFTEDMVLEVTAEDEVTIVEYTIIVES